jgi:hypothetical protein
MLSEKRVISKQTHKSMLLGAQVLCKAIRQGAVVKMDLNERIQKEILTDIKDACAENKGIKKGKKGKKGKKKKKKK